MFKESKSCQNVIVYATEDNKLGIFDFSENKVVMELSQPIHQSDITGLNFSANNEVITSSLDGSIKMFEM